MNTHVRFFLIALCLTFLAVSYSKPLKSRIVGEWKGTEHTGETVSFVFSENGDTKMIRGNLVLDGKTVGRKVSWRLDTGQDPMHLDLIVASSTGESRTLPMIVRFITDSKIQLRISKDMNSRPIEFSDSDNKNQIVLTRQ